MVDCRRVTHGRSTLRTRTGSIRALRTLASSGFTALKAEPLAKAMGVSRGSFYWHFADIGAFHAAILKHWREVAAEQIIAGPRGLLERPKTRCALLLRRAFGGRPALENAVRTWATRRSRGPRRRAGDRPAPAGLCGEPSEAAGLSADVARARAQILYWAFLGFALSDKPLPPATTGNSARRTAADRLAIAAAAARSDRICYSVRMPIAGANA